MLHCFSGTAIPEFDVSVAADASAKLVRYQAAGKAQADAVPDTNSYVGALADDVLQAYDTSQLQATAREQEKQDQDEEEAAEEAAAQAGGAAHRPLACATQLHCNRTTAGSNAKLDFHGAVGLVCTHIIPALGMFLPMPTYEQHYYYDVIFGALLAMRPDVRFIYLDLACRYIKRFKSMLCKNAVIVINSKVVFGTGDCRGN